MAGNPPLCRLAKGLHGGDIQALPSRGGFTEQALGVRRLPGSRAPCYKDQHRGYVSGW